MKRILACVLILCAGLLCACGEEYKTKSAHYDVSCKNTSEGRISIRYTGEVNSEKNITLPGGERLRSFSQRYTFPNDMPTEEYSAVLPDSPIVIYVELPDNTVLTHEIALPYGEGEGARIWVEFDGSQFHEKIKLN